jgi:hypothetical protein
VPIYETASDNQDSRWAKPRSSPRFRQTSRSTTGVRRAVLRALGVAHVGAVGSMWPRVRVAPSPRRDSIASVNATPVDRALRQDDRYAEIVNDSRADLRNREPGPWVLLKSDLERHGYLDERHFFQGNGDRLPPAGLRGRCATSTWRSPCAPLVLGAVRRRSGLNREVFAALKAEAGQPAFRSSWIRCDPRRHPKRFM